MTAKQTNDREAVKLLRVILIGFKIHLGRGSPTPVKINFKVLKSTEREGPKSTEREAPKKVKLPEPKSEEA